MICMSSRSFGYCLYCNNTCVFPDKTEIFKTVLDVSSLQIERVCLALESGTVPQNLLVKLTRPFYALCDIYDTGHPRYFLVVRSDQSIAGYPNCGEFLKGNEAGFVLL